MLRRPCSNRRGWPCSLVPSSPRYSSSSCPTGIELIKFLLPAAYSLLCPQIARYPPDHEHRGDQDCPLRQPILLRCLHLLAPVLSAWLDTYPPIAGATIIRPACPAQEGWGYGVSRFRFSVSRAGRTRYLRAAWLAVVVAGAASDPSSTQSGIRQCQPRSRSSFTLEGQSLGM